MSVRLHVLGVRLQEWSFIEKAFEIVGELRNIPVNRVPNEYVADVVIRMNDSIPKLYAAAYVRQRLVKRWIGS